MSDSSAKPVVWLRSSYSVGMNNCVETALLGPGRLAVRDSKNTAGPAVLFTPSTWASFLKGLRDGEPGGLGSGTTHPAGS
ncbi:DUF397 domain-containing protein [Streptomyces sp. NPDC005336]|uniref:DUF397 domain-containing protein n=1 Tax=unclassified Streptomyces TaxID=2593676 RepID=UPI0033ACB50A